MLIGGRKFSEGILERIRARVRDEPTLTRTALSREVCEWLDWRGAHGQVKDMSCRVSLLKLARREVIALPCARKVSFRPGRVTEQESVGILPVLQMTLAELGEVWLTPVNGEDEALSKHWWSMMRTHHPLGAGPLCGAQSNTTRIAGGMRKPPRKGAFWVLPYSSIKYPVSVDLLSCRAHPDFGCTE